MGLRCSLLGHDYGDSEVEREREEQGSEVVVTIREEQTCSRCGKTKLISENKEVTSVGARPESAGAVDGESGESPVAEAETSDGSESDGSAPAAAEGADADDQSADLPGDGRDAEIIDEGPDEVDEAPSATREAATVTESEGDAGEDPADDPTDDDAVILDDSSDGGDSGRERAPGQWPEADDTRRTTGGNADAEWPSADGEDEGFDAKPADGRPADVEYGGGLAPERASDAGGDEVIESPDGGAGAGPTGFTSADSAPSPVESTDADDATEFACPECGYSTAGAGTSLRAGDICPECRSGYLAER